MPRVNLEKLTTVKIEVTGPLIKSGTINDFADCPVARALRKVVRKGVEVEAMNDDITLVTYDGLEYVEQQIATPARVSKFMEKFDARDPDDHPPGFKLPPLPKPFSFNLKIQNKFLKPSLRT